jgi:hypothetical protein
MPVRTPTGEAWILARDEPAVTIQTWRRLSPVERAAVEAEVASPPLPGLRGPIGIRWDD